MKCDLCKNKIEETFLKKIRGTHLKVNGKKKSICQSCQKSKSMDEIKKELS